MKKFNKAMEKYRRAKKEHHTENVIPVIVLLLIYMPSYYFIVPLFKNQTLGKILMTLICIAIIYITTSKIEKNKSIKK